VSRIQQYLRSVAKRCRPLPIFGFPGSYLKRATMHISHAAFILIFAISSGAAHGQTNPGTPAAGGAQIGPPQTKTSATVASPATSAAPVSPPSSFLKPSLAAVQDTLNNLRLDKWKKGSVRDEAGDHINSLLKDLQTNLPPLIATADAAPASVSQAIPLTKHLDAFYAVMLRVEEAARVSAPSDQISQLQQSLLQLNQSRLALDDQLQAQAAAQEKQVVDLQATLKVQQQALAQAKAQAAAPPPPCKPPAPAKKKPVTKKLAPATNASGAASPTKPAAGQQQGQQSQPQGQKGQQAPPQGQKGQQAQPQGQKTPQ